MIESVIKAKIGNEIVETSPKTDASTVYFEDGKKLSETKEEIIQMINESIGGALNESY